MAIWSAEINELERLQESLKGQLPELNKELAQLIRTDDPNVILLYSRRCLEVIITDLCECELKKPRGTEPLKGIIDKLFKEKKVPDYIITSMHGLNDLSTYGTHPKDFEKEQVKPVLVNLDVIIKWYMRYKGLGEEITTMTIEEPIHEIKTTAKEEKKTLFKKNWTSIITGISLLVLIAVAVVYFTNSIGGGNLARGLEKSIAVLPFINDSPSDSNRYFIDGIMVDILNNLQTVKDLRVISRTSAEKYRSTTKSLPEIAKELGVNYIVEGSGQKSGNTIRLTVQLLRAVKEIRLWGDSYEEELHEVKDIFDIQRQVANSITSELKAIVTTQEKQLIEKIPTMNLDAYEAVMKGHFYWNKLSANDLETALKYYELAKEKDPEYAPAYAGIGGVWLARQQMGLVSPAEAISRAKEALMKAFALDSTAVNLSGYYTWSLWDWEKGEKEFKRVIELNPNDAQTRAIYSHLLAMLGRNEEALTQIEIAVNLDPLNELIKAFYGVVLTFVRKYDEATEAFQDALKIEPNYPFAQGNLGVALALSGRYKDAVEQWKLCNAGDSELVNALEKGYNEGGYKGALLSYNKVAELRYKNSYWNPTDIAMNYAMVGDNDKALYWLEAGYQIHEPNLPYLLIPVYDNLRDDPGFQDLCRKMNLPYK
jgi:TolB-like protein